MQTPQLVEHASDPEIPRFSENYLDLNRKNSAKAEVEYLDCSTVTHRGDDAELRKASKTNLASFPNCQNSANHLKNNHLKNHLKRE